MVDSDEEDEVVVAWEAPSKLSNDSAVACESCASSLSSCRRTSSGTDAAAAAPLARTLPCTRPRLLLAWSSSAAVVKPGRGEAAGKDGGGRGVEERTTWEAGAEECDEGAWK